MDCTNSMVDVRGTNSSCSGGIVDFALKTAKQFGIPRESTSPYTADLFGSVAGSTYTASCSQAQ